mmetsp:Transcript_37585/g.49847  ORF Transcript_37585/g.49847 Transcript_37585/m.49847 type:complete len:292 (-) Transcript_37585:384-1259(-)
MRSGYLMNALSFALLGLIQGLKPIDVQVTLRGKKYTIPNVSTVRELQKSVEDQAGLSSAKQGVLFGGKKLKPSDVLEDMGVEDGSVINIVPTSSKKKSSSSSSSAASATVEASGDVSSGTSSPSAGGGGGEGNFMADMLKQSGIDSDQLDEIMKMMPGGDGEGMPSMKESMEMMQSMMSSPLFQEYMRDPEKLEQSRQMILSNPLMKSMMAGMPGFDEILNDPVKWRETMVAAAEMYQSMGSDLMNALAGEGDMMGGMSGMGGMGGFGGMGGGADGAFGGMSALDELSEGE